METVKTYSTDKDVVMKYMRQDIFEMLLKRLEDYDLINDMSVSFIWKGLKVSKNTLTGNVTIYDTNAKEYTIMSNKFLLSLIHKELKENKELSEKRLLCEIKTIRNDIGDRVSLLERWRWLILGGSIVIGWVLSKNFTYIMNMMNTAS